MASAPKLCGKIRTNVENWRGQLNVTEMTRAFIDTLLASGTTEVTINCAESRVIQAFLSRFLSRLVLNGQKESVRGKLMRQRFNFSLTKVSGYSTWTTLIRLISSGERRPNWISFMVRSCAFEYGNFADAMLMCDSDPTRSRSW